MNKNLIIKKLAEHFSTAKLKTAVQNLSPTPQTNEGLALIDAALQIPNDAEHIWFTAFAVLSAHDSNLAARLLQTATNLQAKPAISGLSQTLFIELCVETCLLTKADAGRSLDFIIESPKTKDEVIAELFTHFTIDYLRATVNDLNNRTPKDEGVDLLWAALKLDPPVDPMQTWFIALSVLAVHDPDLCWDIIITATQMSGNPYHNMNRAELIDAIASGSKLTKADAG
jgi:hypothetical protein